MAHSDLYGTVRVFGDDEFIFEASATTRQQAEISAQSYRADGHRTRITKAGNRGVLDSSGIRRKNCWIIWTHWA